MSIESLDISLKQLADAEEAFAAHARYCACRHLLYQLWIRDDVKMPDFLKDQVKEAMNLHYEGPVERKMQHWIKACEFYRVDAMDLRAELDAAKKKIAELEKKVNG